jgi:hypothetical protein
METGRALDAPRGASDKNGLDSHHVVLSSRAVQLNGAAEPAIPAGVHATSSPFRPWIITAAVGAVREPEPAAFHPRRNLNLTDKQVNHLILKFV